MILLVIVTILDPVCNEETYSQQQQLWCWRDALNCSSFQVMTPSELCVLIALDQNSATYFFNLWGSNSSCRWWGKCGSTMLKCLVIHYKIECKWEKPSCVNGAFFIVRLFASQIPLGVRTNMDTFNSSNGKNKHQNKFQRVLTLKATLRTIIFLVYNLKA